jgi:alpha-tubulin suppressor-like RCC1 family protein
MGSNSEGKLGVGDKLIKNSSVPCLVEGIDKISIVRCGLAHTIALKGDGNVYSWG